MSRLSFPLLLAGLLASSLFFSTISYSQVYGCKDPTANNYNPSATVNDGSCLYDVTSYTPPVKVDPLHSIVTETSGLQFFGNQLWTMNDGGGAAAIYCIDTLTNTIFQTVNIGGATNVDWEDLAFDGTYFYIGDFGNNLDGARTDLKIYRFPISLIPDYTVAPVFTIPAVAVEVINFVYADQPQPPVATASNATRFDCEALIVDGGKIHLFTKNWIDANTTHYVIDGTAGGNYVATPVETLATGYLVTAADKAPGQQVVALLGYQNTGFGNHYMHFLTDYSGGNYFNGNKRKINLPNAFIMGQAEGLSFRNGTYGYISNEFFSPASVPQRLRSFNSSTFVSSTLLANELQNFSVVATGDAHVVNWEFASAVKNLQVQHSSDGQSFKAFRFYGASVKDEVSYTPASTINFYRLAWQNINGGFQFSNIISLSSKGKQMISQIVVTRDGELSFAMSTNSRVAFTITTLDGKKLAQVDERAYLAGMNRIRIGAHGFTGNVIVTTYQNGSRTSRLVSVR